MKMKTLLFASLMLFSANVCWGQNPAYQHGLNGPGSYYSRGGSNYPSGVFVNGNRFNRTYVPGYSNPVYVPSFDYYNQNRSYRYNRPNYVRPSNNGWNIR